MQFLGCISAPGADLPVVHGRGLQAPGREGHQESLGQGIDIKFVHAAQNAHLRFGLKSVPMKITALPAMIARIDIEQSYWLIRIFLRKYFFIETDQANPKKNLTLITADLFKKEIPVQ
jgi:hypothetical protein